MIYLTRTNTLGLTKLGQAQGRRRKSHRNDRSACSLQSPTQFHLTAAMNGIAFYLMSACILSERPPFIVVGCHGGGATSRRTGVYLM